MPTAFPIDKENLNYAPVAYGIFLIIALFFWYTVPPLHSTSSPFSNASYLIFSFFSLFTSFRSPVWFRSFSRGMGIWDECGRGKELLIGGFTHGCVSSTCVELRSSRATTRIHPPYPPLDLLILFVRCEHMLIKGRQYP